MVDPTEKLRDAREFLSMPEDELFAAALRGELGYQPRLMAICTKKLCEAIDKL